MYHPTRGGVRGGRDQFTWDDVKVDKHRENYLGHSLKAPVGRWQKGKDLHWYARDKKSGSSDADALKEELQRIKEDEEHAMREALGLAPKSSTRSHRNRLDKHEYSELVKRGSTAEDLGAGHAESARVDGLGFSRAPQAWEDTSTLPSFSKEASPEPVKVAMPDPSVGNSKEDRPEEDESKRKKRRHEEKKLEKEKKHKKHDRHEKHHRSRDPGDRRKHRKDKERWRHDSDSD